MWHEAVDEKVLSMKVRQLIKGKMKSNWLKTSGGVNKALIIRKPKYMIFL